jgi:hypothetical protein
MKPEKMKDKEKLKKKCNEMLKIELDKFEKYETWVDYDYWLNKLITLFKKYPSKQMEHKEELYR